MIENLMPQIKDLLTQNRKAEAVSLAFEQIGNLSEAKKYIAQLENELSAPVTQEVVKVAAEIVPEESSTPPPPLDIEAIKSQALILLNVGEKIRAIKWVRDETGWDLKEAKQYIDDLQATNKPQINAVNMVSQVVHLLEQKKKIEAVKFVKEQTNWSLREAKDYVDNIEMGL